MPWINRAIELLAAGQPIYCTTVEELSHQRGLEEAATWADYLTVDLEHHPFEPAALLAFMRELVDGGPTRSGHRTPAVIVTLPLDGTDEQSVRANAWMIKQTLAVGVHGLLLCHAETPEAVGAFVEAARYPFHAVAKGLGVGRRGSGGQDLAAAMWGVSPVEYLERADVWPLNPKGELMLGIKIENRRALANAEPSAAVPGLAFAEWGPGDMGMSFGHKDAHDPPYPPEMMAARARVKAACDQAGLAFLEMVRPTTSWRSSTPACESGQPLPTLPRSAAVTPAARCRGEWDAAATLVAQAGLTSLSPARELRMIAHSGSGL